MRLISFAMLWCVFAQVKGNAQGHSDSQRALDEARDEFSQGRYVAAEAAFNNALRRLDRVDRAQRADILSELGDAYTNDDKLDKAEDAYRQSLALYRELANVNRQTVMLRNLAAVYSLQNREEDAVAVLRKALDLAKRNGNKVMEVEAFNIMGVVYYRQRNYGKAVKTFSQALHEVTGDGVPANLSELLNNLGNAYQAEGKYVQAETLLNRALAELERRVGPAHPDLTFTLSSLGMLYSTTNRLPEAERQYRRAIDILSVHGTEFETRMARILHALSATYRKAGETAKANAALSDAAALARRHSNEHDDMAGIIEEYSSLLEKAGRSAEAAELLQEARHARLSKALIARPAATRD